MSHELFALQRASEVSLDLAMAGVVGGLLLMGAGIGFLMWRGKARGRDKPAPGRERARKPKKR